MARPDFPRNLAEFQRRFTTDDECRRYLIDCRWPEGYLCPRCGRAQAYELSTRGLLQCKSCRHQVSVTAGTVLHRTRVPLHLWFSAAYLMTTHTPGFSAVQLQRQLGLTRYETAWTMLQKLRRAMVRPERDRICGTVEVDETYVGGVEEGRRGGRQRDSNKSIVVAAVEVRGRGSGRIRLAVVDDDRVESSLRSDLRQAFRYVPTTEDHSLGERQYRLDVDFQRTSANGSFVVSGILQSDDLSIA